MLFPEYDAYNKDWSKLRAQAAVLDPLKDGDDAANVTGAACSVLTTEVEALPQYTTIDQAKGFVGTLQERRAITEAAASKSEKDTFLSHSSKDNDVVPGVALVLQNHGGHVYVDLGDERLPEPPSVDTAQVLRDTVREMRRFVLLVSPNSKGSIWIPWELGLADGQKSTAAVALFPVVQKVTETKWAEQEYLGLYRRIVWGQLEGHEKSVWMVYDHHTNTAQLLSKWLRGY